MGTGRSIALFFALALVHCKGPVTCPSFEVQEGSRASLTTIDKPVTTVTWSGCSDGKTRAVSCTSAHLSRAKCTCSVDGVDVVEARTEEWVPTEKQEALLFANRTCDWKLR